MGIFKIQIAITPPTFTTVTPYLVHIFLTARDVDLYACPAQNGRGIF
jgi:hypothetical protein